MGRNFYSVCHECRVSLMHIRNKEGRNLHRFADDHYTHRDQTDVMDDYVEEPPEGYEEVYYQYIKEEL